MHQSRQRKLQSFLWGVVSGITLLFVYLASTSVLGTYAIMSPKMEHFHIRMQVEIDGTEQNFATDAFQNLQDTTICKGGLANEPFHFHDKADQIVHVHWQGVTGGQFLKYYGLNEIGGLAGSLGVRFDSFPKVAFVPIHGNAFSTPQTGDRLWVYTGDESNHVSRTATDFLQKSIDDFLGKKSEVRTNSENKTSSQNFFQELLGVNVLAHEVGEVQTTSTTNLSTEDLEKLNDLLGNIVMFVQKEVPSETQVDAKFHNLAPLSDTVCGG